jgi:hypothetical protein
MQKILLTALFTACLLTGARVALAIPAIDYGPPEDRVSIFLADRPQAARAGSHYATRAYMPWAAAPEQQSPSAPIPEPSGVFLMAAGMLLVSGILVRRS